MNVLRPGNGERKRYGLRASAGMTAAALVLAACASSTSEQHSCTGVGGDIKVELLEDATFPKRMIDMEIYSDKNGYCADGELSPDELKQL